MKVEVIHKLDEEQKEQMEALIPSKEELDAMLNELRGQTDNMFAGWEQTKKIMTYTVIGVGIFGFTFGYLLGKVSD